MESDGRIVAYCISFRKTPRQNKSSPLPASASFISIRIITVESHVTSVTNSTLVLLVMVVVPAASVEVVPTAVVV
jgi:hypothetical protein